MQNRKKVEEYSFWPTLPEVQNALGKVNAKKALGAGSDCLGSALSKGQPGQLPCVEHPGPLVEGVDRDAQGANAGQL